MGYDRTILLSPELLYGAVKYHQPQICVSEFFLPIYGGWESPPVDGIKDFPSASDEAVGRSNIFCGAVTNYPLHSHLLHRRAQVSHNTCLNPFPPVAIQYPDAAEIPILTPVLGLRKRPNAAEGYWQSQVVKDYPYIVFSMFLHIVQREGFPMEIAESKLLFFEINLLEFH